MNLTLTLTITPSATDPDEYDVIEAGRLLAVLTKFDVGDGAVGLDATIFGTFIDPASGLPDETLLTFTGPTTKAALKAFVKRVADVRIAEEFDYLDSNGRTEEEAAAEKGTL